MGGAPNPVLGPTEKQYHHRFSSESSVPGPLSWARSGGQIQVFSRTAKRPQPYLSSGFQGVSQSPQPCLGSGFQGVIILVITRKEIGSVALPPIVSSLYQSLEKPQQSLRAWGRVRLRTGNTEMVSAGERAPCVGTWNSGLDNQALS